MQNFEYWCGEVLRCVRFKADHAAIRKELTNHYEDHVKDLRRIGYDEDLARSRALAAMGDAEEVGQGLDKAHKPWLGWLWEVSRCGVVLAVCFMLLFIGAYNLPQIQEWTDPEPYFSPSSIAIPLACPPDFDGGLYDYVFEFAEYTWDGKKGSLVITLTAQTPRFWLDEPKLSGVIQAVDSNGTVYFSDSYGAIDAVAAFGHFRTACLIRLHFRETLPEWVDVTNTIAGWGFHIDIPQEGGTL